MQLSPIFDRLKIKNLEEFYENKKRNLFLGILCLCLITLFSSGCVLKERSAVKKAVKSDLSHLKDTDISALFYKDFSFKVKKITIDENKASARTQITLADTRALAHDFSRSVLTQQIKQSILSKDGETFTTEDSALILKELLDTHEYEKIRFSVDIPLSKTEDSWQVLHSSSLDNQLTGNFLLHTTDSSLLSPSEIVDIHFDTIQNFDSKELEKYLSLDVSAKKNNPYRTLIARALAGQIDRFFDYEIVRETSDKASADVRVTVRGADFQAITDTYKKELSKWCKSSDSLSGGPEKRREKEQELLLSCIENNQATVTQTLDIHLVNDGVSWKIQMDSDVMQAVFGNIKEAVSSLEEI